MEAISFKLSGKTAHFKKPDVNSYAYFTYNNIHKPALLGLLGAVLGLKGYTQLYDEFERLKTKASEAKGKEKKELSFQAENVKQRFPEYYEKLHNLKISIKPLSEKGYFNKNIHSFNNSVGYASKEQGGNLIIREQWLENPQWQILILDDDSIERELFDRLKDYLFNSKTEFIPYLGKNDHPAKIIDCELISMERIDEGFSGKISSLFIDSSFSYSSFGRRLFWHKEFLPISLKDELYIYNLEQFIFTNANVNQSDESIDLYSFNDDVFSSVRSVGCMLISTV